MKPSHAPTYQAVPVRIKAKGPSGHQYEGYIFVPLHHLLGPKDWPAVERKACRLARAWLRAEGWTVSRAVVG